MEINYENLKVSSLNLDDKNPVNRFKTTLIHLFTKKNKDETMARRKRVGTISEERDRNRVFFNFWWTSIQSGLKSCLLNKHLVKEKKK